MKEFDFKTVQSDAASMTTLYRNEMEEDLILAEVYRGRAKRRHTASVLFAILGVLGALGDIAFYWLRSSSAETEPILLYSAGAVALLLILVSLIFYNTAKNAEQTVVSYSAKAEELKEEIQRLLVQIAEEKKKAQEERSEKTQVLRKKSRKKEADLAHILRVTSAVLSAIAVPVASLAAWKRGR